MKQHLRLVSSNGSRASRRSASDSGAPVASGLRALVAPVDLTPHSDRALGRIPLLPLANAARVTLLHVVPGGLTHREQRMAERDAHKALAAEARHLRQQVSRKVRIESEVRTGSIAAEIAACAAEREAELLVMGRGGGRAVRDTFLGSTAERVTRQARMPVLVVRLAPRSQYARPALGLDLDETADAVVRLMLRLLRPPRPSLDIVHAFDAPYRSMVYPSLPQAEADERKHELRAQATQSLASVLAAALAKASVRPEDVPLWRTHVRYGAPRLVLEKFVEKADTDLLMLGTHAHSGLAYVLLGTVAGDVLRAAKCDVLIVPPASVRP